MLHLASTEIDFDLLHRAAQRFGGLAGKLIVRRTDQRGERRQGRRIVWPRRRCFLVVKRNEQDALMPLQQVVDDRLKRAGGRMIILRPPDQIGRAGDGDMACEAVHRVRRSVKHEEE
jgi:hypothetical protein